MGLDLSGINPQKTPPHPFEKDSTPKEEKQKKPERKEKTVEELAAERNRKKALFDAERYLREELHMTTAFDRKLKYLINDDNQLIIRVMDKHTDRVIREIPPEALQLLSSKSKEAIGLIIDELR